MSLSRAQNIFMPANINSIVILLFCSHSSHFFNQNDRLWLSFDSQLIMKRSEKSELWNYKIEILCFARVGKSLVKLKCLLSEALRGPVEKIRTPVLFHKNRPLKRQNTLSLLNKLCIRVSVARCSRLEFFSPESFCVSTRQQVACEMCIVWSSAIRSLFETTFHLNGKITLSVLENCWSEFQYRAGNI